MTKIFKKEVIELCNVIREIMKLQAEYGMISAEGLAEGLHRRGYRKTEEKSTKYSRN